MKQFCENSLCENRAAVEVLHREGLLSLCACCAEAYELGEGHARFLATFSQCDNCRKVCANDLLHVVQDYYCRVDASGPKPSGQCPACGALCYPVEAKEVA